MRPPMDRLPGSGRIGFFTARRDSWAAGGDCCARQGDAASGRNVCISRSTGEEREFRKLFIIRVSAAAEMRGLRYSRLIHGLKLLKVGLDRKSLSELAIHDPQTFDAIVTMVRAENDKHDAAVRAPEGQKGLSDIPGNERE